MCNKEIILQYRLFDEVHVIQFMVQTKIGILICHCEASKQDSKVQVCEQQSIKFELKCFILSNVNYIFQTFFFGPEDEVTCITKSNSYDILNSHIHTIILIPSSFGCSTI